MIVRTQTDLSMLPDAMLLTVKGHARVEHARDDVLLRSYTAAAISLIERKCNVSLNPATYTVSADELRYGYGLQPGWWLPLNNVHQFDATDAAGNDIAADFLLGNMDFGGSSSSYLYPASETSPSMPCSAVLTLSVGVDDPALLAPEFLALILRATASLYENREASVDLWAATFASELMSMWRPCA